MLPRQSPLLRRLGWAVAFVYVIGVWAYGVLYIWEHWAGGGHLGALAYYAFIQAILWPLWVFLGLT